MSLYKIKNLRKSYGGKPVLDIKEISIEKKEIIGLIGSNGSGKSTLLRHLAFLETPDEGVVKYKNFDIKNIPLSVKREISILLPEPHLLRRSVKQNLAFGLKIRGEDKDIDKRVDEALNLVGLLPKKFRNRSWRELSSGETQRVAFASRLILRPRTLLLDEPTNSLDISGVPVFTDAILHAYEKWGTTIIIASHDLDWLSSIATRKYGLHFGRIMGFSTTNLVVGNWMEAGEHMKFCFTDTQSMLLPKDWRIGQKRGVAINPHQISIFNSPPSCSGDTNIHLVGRVREILHLTKSDEVSIKVAIGNHVLESIEPFKDFESRPFFPSQTIHLCFPLEAIKIPR
ncbi:MAG: ABC transporter ATP-binding protein [Campylobacteraceae bacterium]|nr:ABC transporter ATP-binding protein [Campylobacteraceae bacterium]